MEYTKIWYAYLSNRISWSSGLNPAFQVLQLQIAACQQQQEDEKKLKEVEAEWLKEEARLRKEEEKWLHEVKLCKQKAARRSRDVSIRLKNEKEVCVN